jgi:signal transduction histidine kinase
MVSRMEAAAGLRDLTDIVLAINAQRSVEDVLQRLVDGAQELVGARYGALGVPDGAGGFRAFLTAGLTSDEIAGLGPLPRTHGMLGAMLEGQRPFRTGDIQLDPRFRGWWPAGHPDMHSFLGVPITAGDEVLGALYLTDKVGAAEFSAFDQQLIELLAPHAALAITNARLYERSEELSILTERNRLALELHDAVSQKLFSLVLTADAAETLLARDAAAAADQVAKVKALAQQALAELRDLIFELRPPDLERDGLTGALRKHVELLRRQHAVAVDYDVGADVPVDPARGGEILRVAQEALANAVRHAHAEKIRVTLRRGDGQVVLEVGDDGTGFDADSPGLRSRRLGLTSMEERARRLGGTLSVDSAPGAGTRVRLEVPAAA